jgi:putative ABC transport system ATP-binding protein
MIQVKNLIKNFENGTIITNVLRGVDLYIPKGQFVAIMGRSGAGKSTLMYQMSLLDIPTEGTVLIDGIQTDILTEQERTDFRLRKLGFIFQDYALLPELTAVENVIIPLLMRGMSKIDAIEQAYNALDSVDLSHVRDHRSSQLSGGEQQRVSIARAVAPQPDILFADEPTANLDSVSGDSVMRVLKKLHEDGQTIVMVTHEPEYSIYAQRVIYLEDGRVVSDDIQTEKIPTVS